MNACQKRLLELMEEFDSFCKRNGIKYWLSGETLIFGVLHGTVEPRPLCACAAMYPGDCRRFIEAFESAKIKDREIEYWGNSATYPEHTVRYTASDTTAFSAGRQGLYKTNGVHIEIQILRRESGSKRAKRWLAVEREIMDSTPWRPEKSMQAMTRRERKDHLYSRIAHIGKRGAVVRRELFDYFTEECGRPQNVSAQRSTEYSLISGGKRHRGIPGYYFDGDDMCSIEGMVFPVPQSAATLLSILYPKSRLTENSRTAAANAERETRDRIIDVNIPYRMLIKELEISADESNNINKLRADISSLNAVNRDDGKRASADWETVKQIFRRVRLYRHYSPLKGEIRELYKKKDYERLGEMLAPYDAIMEEQLGEGRSLAFDREILKIYLSLLEHRGMYGKAKKIIELLPESHLDDVERCF